MPIGYDGARQIEPDNPDWRHRYVCDGHHATCPACQSELEQQSVDRADRHIYVEVACSNESCGWTGREVYRLIDVE